MRRASTHLSALVLCGMCMLGALAAIAVAAPGKKSAHRSSARHSVLCGTRKGAHGRRHEPRCHSARRHATHHSAPATTPVTGGSPAGEGGGGSGASGVSSTGPVASAPGSPSKPSSPVGPPPSVPRVQVTAVEFSFTLSRTRVPAGKVILELVNHGQDEHNLNAALAEQAPAGSLPNTPANGVRDQTVELRPGTYTLFCSLPEHAKKGMKATLVVE
jgi:plastocyanin